MVMIIIKIMPIAQRKPGPYNWQFWMVPKMTRQFQTLFCHIHLSEYEFRKNVWFPSWGLSLVLKISPLSSPKTEIFDLKQWLFLALMVELRSSVSLLFMCGVFCIVSWIVGTFPSANNPKQFYIIIYPKQPMTFSPLPSRSFEDWRHLI